MSSPSHSNFLPASPAPLPPCAKRASSSRHLEEAKADLQASQTAAATTSPTPPTQDEVIDLLNFTEKTGRGSHTMTKLRKAALMKLLNSMSYLMEHRERTAKLNFIKQVQGDLDADWKLFDQESERHERVWHWWAQKAVDLANNAPRVHAFQVVELVEEADIEEFELQDESRTAVAANMDPAVNELTQALGEMPLVLASK